jgi:hypothetical protein
MEALNCQFCGVRFGPEGQVMEPAAPADAPGVNEVSEQDWVAAIHTEKGHRWALPQNRVLQCQGCGATVTFSPARVSARCAYCWAAYTARVVAPDMGDLREPDGIIPFRFDAHNAMAYVRWWLGEQSRRIGVPWELPALAALQMPTPIYLPFWTFDIAGEVRWSGWVRAEMEVGGVTFSDVDKASNLGGIAFGLLTGSTYIAAHHAADIVSKRFDNNEMVHMEGAVGVVLTNALIPATSSLPAQHLEKMQYKVDEAVPYNEAMLADWPAEVYSVSLADASLKARALAVKQADSQIEIETGNLSTNATQSLHMDRTGISVLSYKLLLLPLWTLDYTFRGEVYRVLINGQSGLMEGDVPGAANVVKKLFGG